jgi:hypothetical protein
MKAQDHRLFQRYPLNGKATLSTGEAPTPYHVYDGYGLLIGGTSDYAATERMLKGETVTPVRTADGRALMAVWVCDFTEASLGPHRELQFAIFVSRQPVEPLARHSFSALSVILTRPDVQMLCHGLWNDVPAVVAYNREVLSLNARQADCRIERRTGGIEFAFLERATGQLLVSGTIRNGRRASLRASWSYLSAVGYRRGMALARQDWLAMRVLNPVGVVLDRNAAAETFTKNDANTVRFFDRGADALEFGDTPYRSLQFTPESVQAMEGFKFVYLAPE